MLYSACPGISGRKTVAKLTALLFALVLVLQPAAVSAATADTYNIANTNAAGVSNNKVNQFNVGANGLVLVNSAGNVTSQLAGGTVAGNANLTNGPARVILFQVTGTGASSLNGITEIAGQKAAFVLANPNGISLNGAGFINAGRVVLTTGTPKMNRSGGIDSFTVQGGQITVDGATDLTGADRIDLISRAIAVSASLKARELNAVAGANKVNYTTLAASKIDGTGTAPAVGIDVSALGGMYADKITLVATERGVGVNSAGVLSATAGNIAITSNGKVTLANSTSATGNITVSGQAVDLSGGIMDAGGNIALKASQGNITNNNYGFVNAIGDVAVTTPGSFDNSQGGIMAGGAFTINAAAVNNTEGFLNAGGNFTATLGYPGYNGTYKCSGGSGTPSTPNAQYTLNNTNGFINAGGNLAITVQAKVTNGPSAPVYAVNNTNGQMNAGRNINIKVTALAGKSYYGTPSGKVYALDNTNGYISAGNDLIITAQDSSTHSSSSKCGSSYHPSQSAAKTNYLVNNTDGQMSAGNDITIAVQGSEVKAQGSHNGHARCGSGGHNTATTAPVTVDNSGGSIAAQGDLTITTKGAVNNAGGELSAAGKTAVSAFDLQNQQGLVNGDAAVTITTKKPFDQTAGQVTSNGPIRITQI